MIAGKEWIKNTIVYEVNLRQYTLEGTIQSFASHLPRLKEMGIDTLWFMPITPISQKNKKGVLGSYYACSDYTSVNPEFGNLNDWKNLVAASHSLGLKVMIDWVANHTGWDHIWTTTHPDWYKKEESGEFKKASGMDDIIELDYSNQSMRQAMIEAMKFWLDTGVDGFRCDLAFWVTLDFWMEAKQELEKIKPLFWLGELDPLENGEYMQVFDAAYTWQWMHKTEQFYKGNTSLADALNLLEKYASAPGIKIWFTTNHDENSWNGTEYEKYGVLAHALAVFSATWPGIPLIYSGQEVPNNKRLKFFEKDSIEWKTTLELHSFYKTLLGLKTRSPALNVDAPFEKIITNADHLVFAYKRISGLNEVLIFLNFSMEEVTIPVNFSTGVFLEIFRNEVAESSKLKTIFLEPYAYKLFEKIK